MANAALFDSIQLGIFRNPGVGCQRSRLRGQVIMLRLRSEEDMAIAKELLDILVCPQCRQKVHLNETATGLICRECQLLYEIRDGIPVMLVEKAKKLDAGSCQASQ